MDIDFSQSTKIRVRYGETDQMGYCYYGNYAQYFEVGRVEALRAVGMSYRKLEESGIMLPVSEFHVRYLLPARYDDELTIITKIVSIKGVRILFDYEIQNDQGITIAKSTTTLVFVAKNNMKPISAPNDLIELLTPYRINHD